MKKLLIALLVIVAVAGVFVISCPDKNLHISVLKQELMKNSMTKMPEDGWEAIGNALASSIIERLLENSLSVDNYFLFSLGRLNDKTVSIGVLGHVFTGEISDLPNYEEESSIVKDASPKRVGAEFYYSDGSRIDYDGQTGTNKPCLFVNLIRREMSAKMPIRDDYSKIEDYNRDLARWNNDPVFGWLEKNLDPDGGDYSISPLTGNLRIYTTVDPLMQLYAEEVVSEHLMDIQTAFDRESSGWNNRPYANDIEASRIEVEMKHARKWSERTRVMSRRGCSQDEIDASFSQPVKMKIYSWKKKAEVDTIMTPNDSILYYKSLSRAALIAMNPATGAVQAYVGNEYGQSYDYATMAKAEVGSSIQPFLYSLAMETGLTPCSTIINARQEFLIDNKFIWTPRSSDPDSVIGSKVTLKWGLSNSSTNVSAFLVKTATPDAELAYLKRFHLPFTETVASICVGSDVATLSDLTAAYNVFANKGRFVRPVFVNKITDLEGNVLYENKLDSETVISEQNAYYITNMLQAAVDHGTGSLIRTRYNLEGDVAGKTGNSVDLSASWFIGYVPNLTIGVWTGWDSRLIHFLKEPQGHSATTSLPIWVRFLLKCQNTRRLKINKADTFTIPDGISPVPCTGNN